MTQSLNWLFGDQTGGQSAQVRNLSRINSQKYNKDFVNNLAGLNSATDYMAKYLIVMQDGIDEANKNIIQKIQDFIADLIIIFTGGSDTGFEFGDLGYIIGAIGQLFGFHNGVWDPLAAALHMLTEFGEAGVNFFIQQMLEFFASLLNMVPIVGGSLSEIVNNIADGLNQTDSTATTAQSTATTAQSTATAAQADASTALTTANAAQTTANGANTQASNAATVAAAAQEVADIAYENSQSEMFGIGVTTSGVFLGTNEQIQGIMITAPDDRIRYITRLIYTLKENTGTMTVQLIHQALDGTETAIHTTNISSGALVFPDSVIDFQVTDLDRFYCNVTAIGGIASGLNCYMETSLLEAAP